MSIKKSLLLSGFVTIFCAGQALAESRMAGKVHVAEPRAEQVKPQTNAPKSAPRPQNVNYRRLESHGLLHSPQEGSLGRSLWSESKRSLLQEYIPELSPNTPYRTLVSLSRRALTTAADSDMIRDDVEIEPGNDLTTLRIEKLLEFGSYKEALALYTKFSGQPYNERFARAGVLAAFYSGEPALACLDVKTTENDFRNVSFWSQFVKTCEYIMSAHTGKSYSGDIPDSKVLNKIAGDKSYKLRPKRVEDLSELKPLEMAVLVAQDRLDLSNLALPRDHDLPPHIQGLLLIQDTLDENTRFDLMLKAAESGSVRPSELADYLQELGDTHFGKRVKNTSLGTYRSLSGFKRAPYLYKAVSKVESEEEKAAIVKELFILADHYGDTILWPFAKIIAAQNPENFTEESIRTAMLVFVKTGIKTSDAWKKKWISLYKKNNGTQNEKAFIRFEAIRTGQNIAFPDDGEDFDLNEFFANMDIQDRRTLEIVHKKLDKGTKFHNYYAADTYEKEQGLTSSDDYVMPLGGLINRLKIAASDQRLGEVIILSCVILRDRPPEEIESGVLDEVLNGLLSVGLTNEARTLASEVLLGLSVRK